MSTQKMSIVIRAIDQMTAPMKRMQKSTGTLTKSLSNLKRVTASVAKIGVAGLGLGGLALRNFTQTAAQFEQFSAILKTVEGSSAKAQKSLDWVSNFATSTPFKLDQVMGSFVKLRSFGLDPMNGLLRTLGDTAAAMGKPIDQAVEAIADAVTGEYERLKEFGIKAMTKGNQTAFEYTDKNGKQRRKIVDKNNRAMIQSTLEAIWNEKYAGAMKEQSKTWEGMVSNLADQWTRFKLLVMKSGVFDFIKTKLSGFLDLINKMANNGQLELLAKQFGERVTTALKKAWEIGKAFYRVVKQIYSSASYMATLVGGWQHLFFILAGIKGLQIAVMLVGVVRGIYAMIAAMLGLKAVGAVSMFSSMAGALGGLSKAWKAATMAAVAYDVASKSAIKGGGFKALKGLSGRLGLVGAAGAAGYGIGTIVNDKLVEGTRFGDSIGYGANKVAAFFGNEGSKQALAIRDANPTLNKNSKTEVGGTLKIEIVGSPVKVRHLEAKGGMGIDIDTGPMLAGAG